MSNTTDWADDLAFIVFNAGWGHLKPMALQLIAEAIRERAWPATPPAPASGSGGGAKVCHCAIPVRIRPAEVCLHCGLPLSGKLLRAERKRERRAERRATTSDHRTHANLTPVIFDGVPCQCAYCRMLRDIRVPS